MDFHLPDYMIANTSYYSDVCNQNINGLLVARICSSFTPSLWKCRISTNDLSTFYLPDIIQLLNCGKEGYNQMMANHKKVTGDINLIDYDELKESLEMVNDLTKMSERLKVVGISSCSVQNNRRLLNIGVCIQGRVSHPDNLFISSSRFYDSKIDDIATIADFLIHGSKSTRPSFKTSNRYSLTDSVIYLIIFKRNGVFDYIVYLSEEPINVLNHELIESCKSHAEFDYIYSVLGRTNTKEEVTPYIVTTEGILFKDIVLESNVNSFSMPIISSYYYFRQLFNSLSEEKHVWSLI